MCVSMKAWIGDATRTPPVNRPFAQTISRLCHLAICFHWVKTVINQALTNQHKRPFEIHNDLPNITKSLLENIVVVFSCHRRWRQIDGWRILFSRRPSVTSREKTLLFKASFTKTTCFALLLFKCMVNKMSYHATLRISGLDDMLAIPRQGEDLWGLHVQWQEGPSNNRGDLLGVNLTCIYMSVSMSVHMHGDRLVYLQWPVVWVKYTYVAPIFNNKCLLTWSAISEVLLFYFHIMLFIGT